MGHSDPVVHMEHASVLVPGKACDPLELQGWGMSTTQEPAIDFDAEPRAQGAVLVLTLLLCPVLLSSCNVRLLPSNTAQEAAIQLSGCVELFLVLAWKKLKDGNENLQRGKLSQKCEPCLPAAQGLAWHRVPSTSHPAHRHSRKAALLLHEIFNCI